MNLEQLTSKQFETTPHSYTRKDTMLYALGVGAGRDPLDEIDLRFTYEKDLVALPTMTCVLASPGFWVREPAIEIDWVRLLHGEQSIELTRALPPEGTVYPRFRVMGVKDRGPDKGATLHFEKLLTDGSGKTVCTVRSAYVLRGDGGCGDYGECPEPPSPLPERASDKLIEIPTLERQALLYRLNGDFNPLHSDPDVARKAGFERPIMHGMGSMGIVCHALVRAYCDGDPTRVAGMSLRFASPFYPGETMALECFEEGSTIRFRAKVAGRDVVVLDRGEFKVAASPIRESVSPL
jgi:acyl dehydratase